MKGTPLTSLPIFASVVQAEWRAMLRNRVAIAGVVLMLLLTLTAILVSREQMHSAQRDRLHFQSNADEQWAEQPDRHPHRVVHYGHFIFRPQSVLAFFDFGIAPWPATPCISKATARTVPTSAMRPSRRSCCGSAS